MAQWELARIDIKPGVPVPYAFSWSPPRGGFRVFGLRFSRPTEISRIHIANCIIATDNPELARRYWRNVDLLTRAYIEWKPTRAAAYPLQVGSELVVDIKTVYPEPGFVELLHEMPDPEPPQPSLAEARRARRIDDCRRTLIAKLPPPSNELGGVTLPTRKR